MRQHRTWSVAWCIAIGVAALAVPRVASCAEGEGTARVVPATPAEEHLGVTGAAVESLTGDVYDTERRWRPLSLGTFFTEGWDEAWVSGPRGASGTGAPRQGWLTAFDGVFYRLVIGTYGFARENDENGNRHTGTVTLFAPLSRRLELQADIPIIQNQRASDSGDSYRTAAGDLHLTPRFLLSETQNVTQTFNVDFRIPTGNANMGNDVGAVTPRYEFWSNCWRGLVVRGGTGIFVPYTHTGVREAGARTTWFGNLAGGYYVTDHDWTPFGDLVFYLDANVDQLTDNRGAATTTVIMAPGFRTHLGSDYYLLGAVQVPVTRPEPYDYQLLAGLMKVF